MVDANFLPPKDMKEAQGKVRQSQGRAAANSFAFSRVRVHRDPLDHLSVKVDLSSLLIQNVYCCKVARM